MTKSKTAAPRKADDPKQSKAFIKKAREIGADEDRSSAGVLLSKLAKMQPKPRSAKRGRVSPKPKSRN
jgi:hypothetical protein